ncbi:MAG: hypothetical protein J6039_06445 [Alphaproteobacteria bacterium]|nr:hypothetical protein [Alphaproteobacteria bacterium]
MKLSKLLYLLTFVSVLGFSAQAEEQKDVDLSKVENLKVAAPSAIARANRLPRRELKYMEENYSTPELARYALRINRSQITQAIANKAETLPPKLNKETLQDRQKLLDYIAENYKYEY